MHPQLNTTRTHPYTLLVIDDEQPILELLGETLVEESLRVTLAPDLPAALTALNRDSFDLVLADALAEVDNDFSLDQWPALEMIKARAGSARVVIFSAHPPHHFACWQTRGFAGFIAKPFDLDELIETVHLYLSAEQACAPSGESATIVTPASIGS